MYMYIISFIDKAVISIHRNALCVVLEVHLLS